MVTLIRGARVLTLDPAQPLIEDGAVLVRDDRIVAAGRFENLRHEPQIEHTLGDADAWVLPGFVNAHYHNWRTFSMGATPDAPLELFLLRLSGFEIPAPLEPEFAYLNTLVSACQLVRSGVALTMDMALSANHPPMIQAYLDLGLDLIYAPTARTRLGYVYTDDDEFLGTLPPDLRERIAGQSLGLTGGYISPPDYWRNWLDLLEQFDGRVQLAIAPDGPEWCSTDELMLWRERASRYGACLHLHNSESPMEMQWALRTRGQTMTEYLAQIGFLGADVSCGHGVWYSDRDIELLAGARASSVHCPSSNLRLSNGIAPVASYLRGGVNMAIGTDGQGFSDNSDFLDELRLADLLQRTPGPDTDALQARTWFEMATQNGAAAFGRHDTGALRAGNIANLLVLDGEAMQDPYLWPGHDPYACVLQRARAAHVDTVISRGRTIVREGRVTTVDEPAIKARLRSLYQEIWRAQRPDRRALVAALETPVRRFFDAWRDLPVQARYRYNGR